MTCRDYERGWNELIDRDRVDSVLVEQVNDDPERALLDHAADCPACRQLGARYHVLRRALRAGLQPPNAPAGLADRVLDEVSAWAVYEDTTSESIPRALMALVAFAAVFVGIALYLPSVNRALRRAQMDRPSIVLHPTPTPNDQGADPAKVPADARNLHTAVADATAATWDLARLASEPATRISRQVVTAAIQADRDSTLRSSDAGSEPDAGGALVPSLAALAPDTAAAEAMVREVGDRLATGVRPLSNSARHAFSFLLGPASAKPHAPAHSPVPKGA